MLTLQAITIIYKEYGEPTQAAQSEPEGFGDTKGSDVQRRGIGPHQQHTRHQCHPSLPTGSVLEGKASVNINGKRYEACPNDLYIGTPNNIVENGLTSLDFKSYSICVSTDYVRRILPLAENSWDVKLLFEKNPLCSLQPEEVRTFCQYYDLLCTKTQQPSPTQKKVIDALMLAFVYDMQGALNRVTQHTPRPFTASETLFKRFIELLGSSYPKPRSVAYYADRLNVTSKYLSSVCRLAGKQRASDQGNLQRAGVSQPVVLRPLRQEALRLVAQGLQGKSPGRGMLKSRPNHPKQHFLLPAAKKSRTFACISKKSITFVP